MPDGWVEEQRIRFGFTSACSTLSATVTDDVFGRVRTLSLFSCGYRVPALRLIDLFSGVNLSAG
jgi:hypothetical protein